VSGTFCHLCVGSLKPIYLAAYLLESIAWKFPLERLTSDCIDLLGTSASFEDWLRIWSTNFLYFVREPGQVELSRDPWFDF
jgi:hypothetical protein